MKDIKYINGFVYHLSDGFLGIDNGNIEKPYKLTEDVIDLALETMLKNRIEKLYFGIPTIKESISFLKKFKFLTGIRIGLNDFEISPLYECGKLEEIVIPFSYNGSLVFSRFPKLKSLEIDWRNQGCPTIFDCLNLQVLTISNYSGTTLLDFIRLHKLEKITLTDPEIFSLAGIEELRNLKEIEIVGAKKLVNIEQIEGCQELENFYINGGTNIDNLYPLMYLSKLKVLNIDSIGNFPSIGFLKPLKKLEEFYMGGSSNVLDGNLNVLQELKEKGSLKKTIFSNRKHYSHTREQLGYQVPADIAQIFAKKK